MTRPDISRATGAKNYHGIVRPKHGVVKALVYVKRQRWPDHFQSRGWDNMWITRPVNGGVF